MVSSLELRIKKQLTKKNKTELRNIILKRILTEKKFNRRRTLTKEIFDRDENKCRFCFSEKYLEDHHLTPRNLGGDDSIINRVTLCSHCHAFIHCNPKWRMKSRTNTKIGMEKARSKGKQIGRPKGSKDKKKREKKGYYKYT